MTDIEINSADLPLNESVETSNDFLLNGDFQERVYELFFDFEFTGIRQDTTPISLGIISDTGKEFYAEFMDYDRDQVDDWIQNNVIKNCFYINKSEKVGDTELYVFDKKEHKVSVYGPKWFVREKLIEWIKENFQTHKDIDGELHNRIEFIGDCCSYDWMLLTELIGEWQTAHRRSGIMVDVAQMPKTKYPLTTEEWKKLLNERGVQFIETKEREYRFGLPKYPEGVNYIPTDICTIFKMRGIDPDINREEYAGVLLKNFDEPTVKHNALWDAKVIKCCYDKLREDTHGNALIKIGLENSLKWNGRFFVDEDGKEYQMEFRQVDLIL